MVANAFAMVHRVVNLTVVIRALLGTCVALLWIVAMLPIMYWSIGLDRMLLMIAVVCGRYNSQQQSAIENAGNVMDVKRSLLLGWLFGRGAPFCG